jgi:nickel-dependent lactate racemase
MQVRINYGSKYLAVEVPDGALVGVRRAPEAAALADPAAAVHAALEQPVEYPALRQALTPDDHVAIVVDPKLPQLGRLLTPILEHVHRALVQPEAITLVCPPGAADQPWVDDLPDAFQDVRIEIHDPTERKRLSYLATTRHGRRLYLNRTVVDADQAVVLTRLGYDPLLGYAGAAGAIYPAYSDSATRDDTAGRPSLDAPGPAAWPLDQEATEAAWLLGAPFFVQVIEGAGDEFAQVIAGSTAALAEGRRRLDERWRLHATAPPDTAIVAISGDPGRIDFLDLARALACAARVVKTDGRIVLLCDAAPALGAAGELLRVAEEPSAVLAALTHQPVPDVAAFLWASAAQRARLYILSGLAGDTVEELFATPLDEPGQVQRLIAADRAHLVIADAHKALAVLD